MCRGICSGGCDFRAKVGLLFGGVILPTMHLDCNLLIQACGSRRLGVVAACLVFVGDVGFSIFPLDHETANNVIMILTEGVSISYQGLFLFVGEAVRGGRGEVQLLDGVGPSVRGGGFGLSG